MPKQITRKQFKLLIIVQFVFIVVAATSSFVLSPFASAEMKTLLDMYYEIPLNTYNTVMSLFLLPIGAWSLQNMIALYQFESYAPKHLLYITALMLIVGFAVMPLEIFPYFGIEKMLYYVADVLFGFTLALVYFSNIANEFKAPIESTLVATKEIIS